MRGIGGVVRGVLFVVRCVWPPAAWPFRDRWPSVLKTENLKLFTAGHVGVAGTPSASGRDSTVAFEQEDAFLSAWIHLLEAQRQVGVLGQGFHRGRCQAKAPEGGDRSAGFPFDRRHSG